MRMPRLCELLPGWDELVRAQRHVVSRAQMLAHGWTADAIEHRLASRQWTVIYPKVYLLGSMPPTDWQRRKAALLYVGDEAAVDGIDACALWGVGLVVPRGDRVDVVDRWGNQARTRAALRLRRTTRPVTTHMVDGLATVDLATGLVVAGRRATRDNDVTALLSYGLQQRGLSTDQLLVANCFAGPVGRPRVERLLLELAPGARYPGELDFVKLVSTSTILPMPELNVWVRLPSGAVKCLDALFRSAALVHETLGRRVHEREDLFGETVAREGDLEEFGLHVLANFPARIRGAGPDVLRQVEAVFMRENGRGMPTGIEVLPGPPWLAREPRGA